MLSADHQNKQDVDASIARQWIDQQEVDVIADVPSSDLTGPQCRTSTLENPLASPSCSVGVIARDQQRLEEAAAEVRELGVGATAQSADVADFAALDRAATRIEQDLGPIDIRVNNAMATILAPFDRVTPQEFGRGTEVT